MTAALELQDLRVSLKLRSGTLEAVKGVSLTVAPRETVAIVGESGCGKSLTALATMKLLPEPPAEISGGRILLAGRDLVPLSDKEMQAVRGREISMIFQDPMSTLNPVLTIGDQLVEAVKRHRSLSGRAARAAALELLQRVRIPDAERRIDDYPHQLSGGMNQRVVIAMAIACAPKVLVADEPTTALDVTIQAQVLRLLKDLQNAQGMALVIITHDLGVVAETADRVIVMYAGHKVEEARVEDIFDRPLHPYTRGLMGATPAAGGRRGGRLTEIPGTVPALADLPPGCPFQNRCPDVFARCATAMPPLVSQPGSGRTVACFAVEESKRDVAPVCA
jgi:peptide/nickel transport system ATP-binding protein